MPNYRRSGCAVVLVAFAGAAAHAQNLEDRGYRPVEQQTGDIDPLARSFRTPEAGLNEQGGQSTRVYRRRGSDRLYYIAPGITASYDRSGYQWIKEYKKEWKLYQLIPPNTIFHPAPPVAPDPEPEPQPPNPIRDGSLIDARVDATVIAATDQRHTPDPRAAQWARYQMFRKVHQRAVLEALDEPEGQKSEDQRSEVSDQEAPSDF